MVKAYYHASLNYQYMYRLGTAVALNFHCIINLQLTISSPRKWPEQRERQPAPIFDCSRSRDLGLVSSL